MINTDNNSFAIEVSWDRPNLPSLVGPFKSQQEAEEWGRLNIVNGVWNIAPMAHPYLQPVGTGQHAGR